MSWLILFIAGLFEIAWAVGLKAHNGRPLLIALVVIASIASVVLLNVAVQRIPLGTAYAVWTGIGIIGTFAVSCLFLSEVFTIPKLAFTALIIAGIIGLKLSH
jgi:quaternary ammonium compound-resistance protein SugE